jgi:hypothetical protein
MKMARISRIIASRSPSCFRATSTTSLVIKGLFQSNFTANNSRAMYV